MKQKFGGVPSDPPRLGQELASQGIPNANSENVTTPVTIVLILRLSYH